MMIARADRQPFQRTRRPRRKDLRLVYLLQEQPYTGQPTRTVHRGVVRRCPWTLTGRVFTFRSPIKEVPSPEQETSLIITKFRFRPTLRVKESKRQLAKIPAESILSIEELGRSSASAIPMAWPGPLDPIEATVNAELSSR